jgi:hypothetical protein
MTTRKIADLPTAKRLELPPPCYNPEHRPPTHMVYEPGIYEHTCPGCGRAITFRIDRRY